MNSFVDCRRNHRIKYDAKQQSPSELVEMLFEILSEFPSSDLSILCQQLEWLTAIFKNLGRDAPFDKVAETQYTQILFSLFIKESLDFQTLSLVVYLIGNIVSSKIITNFLKFVEEKLFIQRIIILLQLHKSEYYLNPEQKHDINCLIAETIGLIKNIFSYYPSGKEIILQSGINQIFETQLLLCKDNFNIFCLASNFLIQIIPHISIKEEKQFIVQLISNLFKETTENRPLTHLLNSISLCIDDDHQTRTFFVAEGICEKCSQLIMEMKDIGPSIQWITIHSLHIFAIIANKGSAEELTLLMNSHSFEAIFIYKYSFFDISGVYHIDNSAFCYTVDLVCSLIVKNEQSLNRMIIDNGIIHQICEVYINGPHEIKKYAINIMLAFIMSKNAEMCSIFTSSDALPKVLEMLTVLEPDFILQIISAFLVFASFSPQSKELFMKCGIEQIIDDILSEQIDSVELQERCQLLSNCLKLC